MAYTDGSVYDGAWKYNKRHGDGLYKYANGDRYAGVTDDLQPDIQPELQTTHHGLPSDQQHRDESRASFYDRLA